MLTLSRKIGETLCIGENISITVVDVERGKASLRIDAPPDVPIYRQEPATVARPTGTPDPNTEDHGKGT